MRLLSPLGVPAVESAKVNRQPSKLTRDMGDFVGYDVGRPRDEE